MSLNDLDKNAFEVDQLNPDILTSRRVKITDGTVDAVPGGLRNAFLVTTLDMTDTAGTIPGTALTDRNAVSIHNLSTSVTIYIGPANTVTADRVNGTTSGWELGPGEFFNLDVTDNIPLYGICPSGQSAQVKVMELS